MNHFPAEWAPHAATWMAWPYDTVSFPDRVANVEREFVRMIGALAAGERVKLVVRKEQEQHVREKLSEGSVHMNSVDIILADYADVWVRDWGPTFVTVDGQPSFVKWHYNAYGKRFPELLKDDTVIDQIPEFKNFQRVEADMFMEGGAIETNGAGIVLTTEECMLNQNRNHSMGKADVEKKLKDSLGASEIVWLKRGLLNDHTDGHVDEIARFVGEDTILYAWEDAGANHDTMRENLEILQKARTPDGRPFNLAPLPLPRVTYDWNEQAPASYCNFYPANEVVLVPQFGDKNDVLAKEILQNAFPGRTILGIDSTDLLYGGGGIHCVTQQQPAFS